MPKSRVTGAPRGRPAHMEHPFDLLLAMVQKKFGLANRAAAERKIGVGPCAASRIRNDHYDPSPRVILRIYDATDWSIERIREILELPQRGAK